MVKSSFSRRSQEKELIDSNDIPCDLLIQNLQEFEKINVVLGFNRTLLNTLNEIYLKSPKIWIGKKIVIADLGCGGGDILRAICKWVEKKKLECVLLGLDVNTEIINYAINQSQHHNLGDKIKFETLDISADELDHQCFDIVCLNNVCHHFTDDELVLLLQKLQKQCRIAIIINDLHRHPVAYYAIKAITNFFGLSDLARHDGPLSVLRAFTRSDLISILQKMGATHYQVRWKWPFRWQVILWCKTGDRNASKNE